MAHGNKRKKERKKEKTLDMDGKFYPIFFFLVGSGHGGGGDSSRDGNGEFSKRETRTRDGKK